MSYSIEKYLPKAIEIYLANSHRLGLDRDVKDAQEYLVPKLERFLEHYGHLKIEELLNEHILIKCEAYDLGILTSAAYSEEEIAAKKSYYQSLLPLPQSGLSIKKWQGFVKKYFMSRDLSWCPDKVFSILDAFRTKGYI